MSFGSRIRALGWPIGIFCVFGVSLSVCGATIMLATSDPTVAIEDDYYAKAVGWDDIVEQRLKSEQLGWRAEASESNGEVRLSIVDDAGEAVAGASVEALMFHHADRKNAESVEMTAATEDGRGYVAALPSDRVGMWQLRVRATRGDDVFLTTIDLNRRGER